MKKVIYIVIVYLLLMPVFALHANAATLNILSEKSTYPLSAEFTVDVKIESEDQGINGVQATLQYDRTMLDAVKVDTVNSIFDFWLREPSIAGDNGQVSFIAASTKGYSGKSLEAFRITFKPKGSGKTSLSFTDAAITAADGSGTNVLSKLNGLALEFAVPGETVKIPEAPQQIQRTPEKASGLPGAPQISVPLYPDPKKWNNASARFFVNVKLPADITDVAMVLNKVPVSEPTVSEGLFELKEFSPLSDGTYYLHARFRNTIGWGAVTHYKIAVDTKPPQGFIVNAKGGTQGDNPQPALQFKTSDALSGLKEYRVHVNDGPPVLIPAASSTDNFVLPLQTPGKKKVFVRAVDRAENSVEESVEIEILPIASPTITFTPTELFSDGKESIVVKGTAVPNLTVHIRVEKSDNGALFAERTTRANNDGNWEYIFDDQPVQNGAFVVRAQGADERGALSLVVSSPVIYIRSEPVFQLGIFRLDAGGAALLLLIILVGGIGAGIWLNIKRNEKFALRVELTESEITKIFKLIADDINKVSLALKTSASADDEYALQKLTENIKKMELYLKKNVAKIKR